MIDKIDDIDNRKRKEENKKIVNDITEIIEGVTFNLDDFVKRKSIEKDLKNKKKPNKIFRKFLNWLGLFGLFVLALNFVLGNIWLLSKLIKSLFFIK
jgi:hypothetical protein